MIWEYKVEKVPVSGTFKPDVKVEAIDAVLDPLGAAGWELVSSFGIQTGNGATIEIVLMLKRPRAEAPSAPEPLASDGPPPLP